MNITVKRLVNVLFPMLASAYLTHIVDSYTLNSNLERTIFFLYFFTGSMLLLFLRKKFAKRTKFSKHEFLAAAFISIGLLIIFQNKFLITSTSSILQRVVYNTGAFIILLFLLCSLVHWLMPIFKKNKKLFKKIFLSVKSRWQLRVWFVLFLYAANTFVLFCTSPFIIPLKSTGLFLAVVTGIAFMLGFWGLHHESMKKYHKKLNFIILLVISAYASLASFGYRFFLSGNVRPQFRLSGVLYCVLGMIWFIPVINAMLIILELLSSHFRISKPCLGRKQAFLSLLIILCVCQIMALFAFWPGGFITDSMSQLRQAAGDATLDDWHPVLHTLFMRLVYMLIPNAGAITAVQMFVYAFLLTTILMIGYDHGLPLGWLCFGGSVFILLPNQVFSSIVVVKDLPYMLALLWGTYLLFKLAIKDKACKRPWYFCALTVDMFLVFGFRHNGIVPFVTMILLCIWLTIRHFSLVQFRALTAAGLTILSIIIYKGPVFHILNVSPNTVSNYVTMLCAVGSCVNKDLPLSDETNKILKSIMPLEDWRDYYGRFLGHDNYVWGRGDGKTMDTTHITAKQAFSMYFEALGKYPDVNIKDRLDGMNIMWDITQPKDPDSFNSKTFDYVHNFDYTPKYIDVSSLKQDTWGGYFNRSWLAEQYRKALQTQPQQIADMLLWRSGAYLVLLLVLLLFWKGNRMGRMFWAAVPLLGNIAGSILVLYHQSFRYVYFIQVLTLALVFISICTKKKFTEPKSKKKAQPQSMTNSFSQ